MMAGSGRRFALEAAFLAGLAVAVGLAELSTGRIIGVMALGWLLTVLVELVSWRLAVRHPIGVSVPVPARPAAEEARAPVVDEPEVVEAPAPDVRDEEPAPERTEHAPGAQAGPAVDDPEPQHERRRGFWRRRAAKTAVEPEPPPRHVRLIPKEAGEPEASPDAVTPAERAEGA
jgi:hypothetical protein